MKIVYIYSTCAEPHNTQPNELAYMYSSYKTTRLTLRVLFSYSMEYNIIVQYCNIDATPL